MQIKCAKKCAFVSPVGDFCIMSLHSIKCFPFFQLEPTAEDFNAIKDTEYHPELCSVNTMTETPAGPLDPTTADFLFNVYCSEPKTAPDSAEQD